MPSGHTSVAKGSDFSYQSREPVFKPTMRLFAGVLYHAGEETDWNPDINIKAGVNIRSPYAEKRPFRYSANITTAISPSVSFTNYGQSTTAWGLRIILSA